MTTTPCTKCGQHHPGCSAHSKRHHGPCGGTPLPGQDVCHWHGGRSPNALTAAKHRGEIATARAEVEARHLPTNIDPQSALLDELRRTAGWVLYLETKVDELDEKDLVWGRTREKTGGDDHGTTHEAKPNAWYALLTAERKHLLDVAKACVAAGIEERRIALAEDQGRAIAGAIQQILTALNLTLEQQQLVPTIVPAALRSITTTEEN